MAGGEAAPTAGPCAGADGGEKEADWVEALRGDCEPEQHWRYRREFLIRNAEAWSLSPGGDEADLRRLVSFSMAWANHVFLGCRYPQQVMEKMLDMAAGITVTNAPTHTLRDELVAKVKRGISSSNEGLEEPCKKRAVATDKASEDSRSDARSTTAEVPMETGSETMKNIEKDRAKDPEKPLSSTVAEKMASAVVPAVAEKVASAAAPVMTEKVASAAAPAVAEKVVSSAAPAIAEKAASAAAPAMVEKVASATAPAVAEKEASATVPAVAEKVASVVAPAVAEKAASVAAPAVVQKVAAAPAVAQKVAAAPAVAQKVAAAPAVIPKVVSAAAPAVAQKVASVAAPAVAQKGTPMAPSAGAKVEPRLPNYESSTITRHKSALASSASGPESKINYSSTKPESKSENVLPSEKKDSLESAAVLASKSSLQTTAVPAKMPLKLLTSEDAKERQPFFNRLYKAVAWKLVAVGGFSPTVNHVELLNSSIQSVKATLDVDFVPLKELTDLPQNKSSQESVVCELRCKSVYLGTGCGKSKENAKAVASREALKLFLKKKVIVKLCKRKYKGREVEDLVLLDEESKPLNLPPALRNPQEIL